MCVGRPFPSREGSSLQNSEKARARNVVRDCVIIGTHQTGETVSVRLSVAPWSRGGGGGGRCDTFPTRRMRKRERGRERESSHILSATKTTAKQRSKRKTDQHDRGGRETGGGDRDAVVAETKRTVRGGGGVDAIQLRLAWFPRDDWWSGARVQYVGGVRKQGM